MLRVLMTHAASSEPANFACGHASREAHVPIHLFVLSVQRCGCSMFIGCNVRLSLPMQHNAVTVFHIGHETTLVKERGDVGQLP